MSSERVIGTKTNHVRNQRKNQNARQATMISGLSTIYRNQSMTHAIQSHQITEPRIFLLDISLEDMNNMYAKIHGIIEKGRLRPKGTEVFFVYKKMEHLLISEDAIYEIQHGGGSMSMSMSMINQKTVTLNERIPVDGAVSTFELNLLKYDDTNNPTTLIVPLLVDESYYKFTRQGGGGGDDTLSGTHISPKHIVERHMKIVVKMHPKSMNAFVFIMNENETQVLDFYFTTENGLVPQCTPTIKERNVKGDILTKTCKDDIISFLEHFKLCS
jgi:hypothetical protein